ncbi:MAG: hypothetical protein C4523_00005 [Myxococcales bacterium]|nr:MAG: hypothetical protein C4523_00005 [Myxococcales bacterium]
MERQFIEAVPIPDVYADDIAYVDVCGPNVRIAYYTIEKGVCVICNKVVMPRLMIQPGRMLKMIARSMESQFEQAAAIH